jgi:hypothetical protein
MAILIGLAAGFGPRVIRFVWKKISYPMVVYEERRQRIKDLEDRLVDYRKVQSQIRSKLTIWERQTNYKNGRTAVSVSREEILQMQNWLDRLRYL